MNPGDDICSLMGLSGNQGEPPSYQFPENHASCVSGISPYLAMPRLVANGIGAVGAADVASCVRAMRAALECLTADGSVRALR